MNELIGFTDDADDAADRRRSMNHISLAVRHIDPVEQLPGFGKQHRVPREINPRTQAFVGRLADQRIRDDLDRIFSQLRSAFRFKRTELETSEWDGGAGAISTPFFRYESATFLNPDDASEAIWQRDISRITEPHQLLTDSFATVFGELFDTVECSPPSPIDLVALIDRIEAKDDASVALEYNRQLTYCEVSLAATAWKIRVTPESFRIVHPRPKPASVLLESFFKVQQAIVDFSSGRR